MTFELGPIMDVYVCVSPTSGMLYVYIAELDLDHCGICHEAQCT